MNNRNYRITLMTMPNFLSIMVISLSQILTLVKKDFVSDKHRKIITKPKPCEGVGIAATTRTNTDGPEF